MRLEFKLLIICLVVLALSAFPFGVFAVSESSISVNLTPENPSPNENTTITLSSYTSNLDSVLISWFVNGLPVQGGKSGIGKKSFSLNAPATGSVTTVRALISLPGGEIEKKITIKPSVMVLLSQAIDSYVPPFYRGKALPTADSEIKVVAMPEIKNAGGTVNPKNLVYTWKRNYNNEVEGSGYGQNFFVYINDYLEDSDNIGVTASTVDQQYSSQASLDIRATQPRISFYKNDGQLGTLWEEALGDGHRIQGDEIVVAEPYFISPKEIQNPVLVWNWFINDNMVQTPIYRKNFMPLRAETGTSGESKLRLEIENNEQLLGTASKEISIEF